MTAREGVRQGGLGGLKQRATATWQQQLRRRYWLAHVLRAWTQLGNTNGSLLAGALTFFSFLALFPMILLGVSIMGYVLSSHPHLQTELLNKITSQAPGGFGQTLRDAVNKAIDARAGVGIIALAGVALTGIGWVNNLRVATEQVWSHEHPKVSFLKSKIADATVLVGLGLGLIISVALSAVGSTATGKVTELLGIQHVAGITALTKVITIAVAVLADMVIFVFLLVRLPKADVPRGVALRGALLASVGFEILKIFGTYYITKVSMSPTAGIFGSVLGILVWLNLVFRFLLYCTAWTATGTPDAAGGTAFTTPPQPGDGMPGSAADGSNGPVSNGLVSNGSTSNGPAAKRPARGVAVALMLGAFARSRKR